VILSRPALILAISILFVAVVSSQAMSDTISIGGLSKLYQPLKFTHDKHMEIGSNCNVCHGAARGAAKKKTVTGLKDAYHGRCIGCHKELSGPVECAGCHNAKKRELDVLYLKTISNIYGPAYFPHGRHIDAVSDCALCHHQAEDNRTSACKGCHDASPVYKYKGNDRRTELGLKGAYHGLCVGCHQKASGPVGCVDCHKKQGQKG
jgi:hypothetical protein